ncbi:pyrimidine 5'-nucleotidase [Flexibacterium corallicola]|uniref:pyrimidine 5'-nucleotidase n=1 Tax=Flexibacterium corallicola TaxID=3037259 RepID=UPI00286F523F|nr:pyrimidine 5'-nucleotidase [Pseudovibrio sp. M1P-2-3]
MSPVGFSGVNSWIFDLDNTLYPAHSNLFPQIDEKISDYVQKITGKSRVEARAIQKSYYKNYGTTLRGLMVNHEVEPDDFLEFVHDIDHSELDYNHNLRSAIEQLPGKCYIMTNGSKKHAEAVAHKLGIHDQFEEIFGIMEAGFIPKPEEQAYSLFLQKNNISPHKAVMFEDLSRNLLIPDQLGMKTVLVVPQGTREVFREDWEMEGQNEKHVHFITEDLGGFLHSVINQLPSG